MSTLRVVAVIFGIVFLAAGVLGFVPGLIPGNMLFGMFLVDTMHNLVHILTGLIALFAAKSDNYAKLFFKVFGVIYLLVALLGFFNQGNLFLMQVNMYDNWLHLVIALVSLYFGFLFGRKKTITPQV